MSELMIPAAARIPGLYGRMQTAIAQCYDLDDCKVIADQSAAIAAYYKQIKDDESMRKFLSVKLRAWRRIGEICAATNKADCPTKATYCAKIKLIFPDLTESEIYLAVRLTEVPLDFFERVVSDCRSISEVLRSYSEFNVTGRTARENREMREASYREAVATARETGNADKGVNQLCLVLPEVAESYKEAHKEVGYTMDRRDRRNMKTVVLLLKSDRHEVLRQAAFANQITMQEILRQGMDMWLKARGIKAP